MGCFYESQRHWRGIKLWMVLGLSSRSLSEWLAYLRDVRGYACFGVWFKIVGVGKGDNKKVLEVIVEF